MYQISTAAVVRITLASPNFGRILYSTMGSNQASEDDVTRLAGVIAERFESQLAGVVETIDSRILQHLQPIGRDIADLKDDVAAIKVAIKETNQDIHLLENRVDRLEAAL